MERGWILAIDFGTTNTSAAIASGGRVDVVEIDGSARMSSAVFVDDQGELIVGFAADAHLPLAPDRAERTPKRRLGDSVMVLGATVVEPVDAVAAVLRSIAAEAIRRQGGEQPTKLCLTHPARWGGVRLRLLAEAASRAGLPAPVLVPEPVAAALYFADERISPGSYVAVYDLGGGTFDTAVLRRTDDGFEVAGPPGGDERVGGELFDERIHAHLGARLATAHPDAWESLRFDTSRTWRKAAHDFRREVRQAKESLSAQADYTIYLGAPVDAELLLTREELETLVHSEIEATVDELLATISRAGLTAQDLAAVNIVGGSSRIPLVTRLVAERVGRVPDTWGDPKAVVALGAVRALGDATLTVETPIVLPAVDGVAASAEVPPVEVPERRDEVAEDEQPLPDVEPEPGRGRLPLRLAAAAAVVALVAGMLLALTRDDGEGRRRANLASDPAKVTSTTKVKSSGAGPTTTTLLGAVSGEAAPGDTVPSGTDGSPQSVGEPSTGGNLPGVASTTTTARPSSGTSTPTPQTTTTTTKADVIAARSVPAGMKPEQNRMVRLIPDDAVRMSCRPGPGWNMDEDGYVEAVQCSVPEGSFYLESYSTSAQAEAVMRSFNRLEDHPAQTANGCSTTAFYFEGNYSTADDNPDGILRCLMDGDTAEMYWTDSTHRVLGWIWRYDGDFAALFNAWSSGIYGFDL